jgi:hypothetical protein
MCRRSPCCPKAIQWLHSAVCICTTVNLHSCCLLLQVLELVLLHITDTQTLILCSLVSTEFRGLTQHTIKQNIPALLAACPCQPTDGAFQRPSNCPLLWLCSTAGPAVNTFESGCALLQKVFMSFLLAKGAVEFLAKAGGYVQDGSNCTCSVDANMHHPDMHYIPLLLEAVGRCMLSSACQPFTAPSHLTQP